MHLTFITAFKSIISGLTFKSMSWPLFQPANGSLVDFSKQCQTIFIVFLIPMANGMSSFLLWILVSRYIFSPFLNIHFTMSSFFELIISVKEILVFLKHQTLLVSMSYFCYLLGLSFASGQMIKFLIMKE